MTESVHKAVLLKEAIEYLSPQPGQNFIDCTLGGGGHARAILEKIKPNGKLLAIDSDKEAIKRFVKANEVNEGKSLSAEQAGYKLINDNFVNLKKIIKENNFSPVHGILADFGFSSDQIEDSKRGFSFLRDSSLDMRYDKKAKLTAGKIINEWSQAELEQIFKEYGEEWLGGRIAKQITKERKKESIKTTFQLSDIIQKIKRRRGKIHPATKVFQALRIAVNDELGVIERFLPQAVEALAPGGRLAVITFHSLEDRIAKYFFRSIATNIHACRVRGLEGEEKFPFSPSSDFKINPALFENNKNLKNKKYIAKKNILEKNKVKKKGWVKLINKKVIKPKWEEIKSNKRARSAKMRVVEKV